MGSDDVPSIWSPGILLKQTNSGVTWSIAVQADSSELDDLRAALWKAVEVHHELRDELWPVRTIQA